MLHNLLFLSGFLCIGMICSIATNSVLLRFAKSLGIRNKNNVIIRWNRESKPSLGGVSFFVAFVFTINFIAVIFSSNTVFDNSVYIGLIGASGMAFFMGLADDAYDTKPFLKLFVQILCGIALVGSGSSIVFFNISWLDGLTTVFWVVFLMNSLNMLDNMDGITGITVVFILLTCLGADWSMNGVNIGIGSLMLLAIIGALVGFLFFNFYPSKLFMGDAGSQFIGLFVAFFSTHNLWNFHTDAPIDPVVIVCLIVVVFTPALADTLTVVINRLKKGKSPMVGGKDHTTHHLVYSGLSDIHVWFVFFGLGLIACLLGLWMISLIQNGNGLVAVFFVLYFLITFFFLYRNTIRFPGKINK